MTSQPASVTPVPRVSILMPVFNAGATLDACLESIRAQTLRDHDLVMVDDGSEDGSSAIMARWAQDDRRIRLLQPGKVGLTAALNLGLAATQAPLVARMDADDLMAPTRLEKQADYLWDHPDHALVSCQVALFGEEEMRAGWREYARWQNACLTPGEIADEIYWESPLAHPSVMFRRQAVLALGGYRDGPFPEDYDLWLRMNRAGLRMAKIPEILLEWRDGPTRLSRTDPRYRREAFDRLRAGFLAQDDRLRQGRRLVVWGAGRPTRKRVRRLTRLGFCVDDWVDVDPKKIGHRVEGALVRPPEWLRGPEAMAAGKPFVLSYVVKHGAREEIRQMLAQMDYLRGQDYLMVG